VASGTDARLLPDWLPDGWTPSGAGGGDWPDGLAELSGTAGAYGDATADDPWAAPVLAVTVIRGDGLASQEGGVGEPTEVAGRPGALVEKDGQWAAQATFDGTMVAVVGMGGASRDQVVTAAAAATTDGTIAASGLPDGFVEIARGGLDTMTPELEYLPRRGVVVGWSGPAADGDESGPPGISLTQRPGPADAVDLLRLGFPEAEATTVRGHHALVARRGDQTVVQWLEAPDLLVTVGAQGVDEADVDRFVDGLRPVSDDEVSALVERFADPGLAGDGGQEPPELRPGQTLVTEGDDAGTAWRLIAEEHDGDVYVNVTSAADGWSGMLGVAAGADLATAVLSPTTAPYATPEGDRQAVFGAAAPGVASVTLEQAAGAVELELTAIPGRDEQAFVGWVARATDGALSELVARDAAGAELVRLPLGLDLAPSTGLDG
jgi:hypothetical protein